MIKVGDKIVLASPRTASRSIARTLEAAGYPRLCQYHHATKEELDALLPENCAVYSRIRNPFEYVLYQYRIFLAELGWTKFRFDPEEEQQAAFEGKDQSPLFYDLVTWSGISFDDFFKDWRCPDHPDHWRYGLGDKLAPYRDYVDVYCAADDPPEDFLSKLGVSVPVARIGIGWPPGPKEPYSEFFTSRQLDSIAERYPEDIALYETIAR